MKPSLVKMYPKYSLLTIGYCQSNSSLLLRNNAGIHLSCESLVNLLPGVKREGFTFQCVCMNLNAFFSFLSTLWP